MGTGRFAGDGIAPDRNARFVFRDPATRLCRWLSAGSGRLLDRIPALRLARIVSRGRFAGATGHLHSGARSGIASLATQQGAETTLAGEHPRIHQTTSYALYSCRPVDDGVQLHVAWHAGSL